MTRGAVEIGVTTIIQVIGLYCFKWFNFVPASALTYGGKVASDFLNHFVRIETEPAVATKNVNARVEFHRVDEIRESLTQYE